MVSKVPPSRSLPSTPLFVKTQDFAVWLFRHTQRFPKNLRHSYTHRLEQNILDFQELIFMANAHRGDHRIEFQTHADGKLLSLRALLRLAIELELLAGNQLKFAAERVDELGRLLGAWRKGTNRQAPA